MGSILLTETGQKVDDHRAEAIWSLDVGQITRTNVLLAQHLLPNAHAEIETRLHLAHLRAAAPAPGCWDASTPATSTSAFPVLPEATSCTASAASSSPRTCVTRALGCARPSRTSSIVRSKSPGWS